MQKSVFILLFCILTLGLQSQNQNKNRKKMEAVRVENPPKIDGVLDDEAWKKANIAKDFVMMRPDNGKKEAADHKTEVKLVYDDDAIYISAKMDAPDPAKIPKEFVNRDNIGNADFFMAMINPNDDGQNPFAFAVTTAGVQVDFKVSNGGNEDWNWSAVWDSAHKITKNGWVVEIKIPYRALRFANEKVQSWGMNFHREIRNLNARYTWNFIDNTQGSWTQYDGLVENFRNIKPPVRLAFYPYAQGAVDIFDGHAVADWSVGMDVKYGITENFTLDATLIPDFGQVRFDDVELNLGPFEQQFSEQRQFFTEGTELFNIGNLFYSRRIGEAPIDQFNVRNNLGANEIISEYPEKVDMLNAVKISGRTKKGLGIGFFNAITKEESVIISNTATAETREEIVSPFTNYNIMVLDQQFNQNSNISLINTNVTRDGRFRDANATALDWHVEDKSSTYNIDGSFKMTHLSDDITKPSAGYAFDTSIGKHAGNWNWEVGYNFENKDFDPNDFGILFSNNEQTIYSSFGYRTLQPKGIFNNYRINTYNNVNFQHYSGVYTGYNSGLSFGASTRERFSFGGNLNFSSKRKDFFEPRQGTTSGVYFERPLRLNFNHWISTDFRKKFSINFNSWMNFFNETVDDINERSYGFGVRPRYRFNDRFSLIYGLNFNKSENQFGYVTENNNDIIFGRRDRTSYNNSLSGKYSFSNTSSLSLTFRHNWSKVPYNSDFYALNRTNGRLENSAYTGNHDVNFNSWNLDLNYVWQFAPGSQLIAFYRNSIFNVNDVTNQGFIDNLDSLFEQPNQHIFSVRFVYFIDYNNIKNIF